MKIKDVVIVTGTKSSTLKVANWRANRSVEKVQLDQFQAKVGMSKFRDNLSDEERYQIKLSDKNRKAEFRVNLSDDAREQLRLNDKNRKATSRLLQATKLAPKAATLSEDIMMGLTKVLPLEETGDSIGQMNHVCSHCGAKKFLGEPPTTCCLNGQINLLPFPKPPAPILDLFCGSDVKSRIFKDHARNLNNAVCLSSLKVNQKRQGFTPSVIFQGKVTHIAGPLGHIDGEIPHYAQLYVLDSSMELTQRFEIQNILHHSCCFI